MMKPVTPKKLKKEAGCLMILSQLCHLLLVPKSVMLLGKENENTRNNYIRSCIEQGFIKETKEESSSGTTRFQRQNVFLSITPAGLRYLIANTQEEYLKRIDPEQTKGVGIVSSTFMEKSRFALVSESAAMAQVIGAKLPILPYTYQVFTGDFLRSPLSRSDDHFLGIENYDKTEAAIQREREHRNLLDGSGNYITNLIAGALEEERRETGRDPDEYRWREPDYIRWYLPELVKISYVNAMADPDRYDIRRGRFTGLIQSKKRSLLTYGCHEEIFPWPRSLGEKEQVALNVWIGNLKREFSDVCYQSGSGGCFFVPNPKVLRALWYDRSKRNRSYTHLGTGLSHLYLIPETKDGAAQLRKLMLRSDGEIYAEHRRVILEDGMSESPAYSSLFPYQALMIDEEGEEPSIHLVADLTLMDICRIREIESFHARYPDVKIAAILHEWQIPFLEFICEANHLQIICYEDLGN